MSDNKENIKLEETKKETTEPVVVVADVKPMGRDFSVGDTVKVFYKIVEGDKFRVQPYEGIVIAIKGKEHSKTFTVRRIGANQIGVERIFPIESPNIEKITISKYGKVRKAKLYYLRKKIGKAATKIKERKPKAQ